MYFPATKVEVLASSVTKRGAALRRGSLGYVANFGGTYSPTAPNPSIEQIPYILTPGYIVVTRFGNEVKRRVELKPVIYVVPTQPHGTRYSKLKSINNLLEDAKRFTGQLSDSWKDVGMSIKQLPFIVVVPTTKEASLTESCVDFNAWVTSIFASKLLRPALAKGKIGRGSGAALIRLLSDYLPPQQDFEWYKYFMHQKEVEAFLTTLPKEKKLQFITFLQGQRSTYIREYIGMTYGVYGSENDIQRAIRSNAGIDLTTPNIPGLYNLNRWWLVQKQLELAWLDICYNLDIQKGEIKRVSEVRKNMSVWIDRITTFK